MPSLDPSSGRLRKPVTIRWASLRFDHSVLSVGESRPGRRRRAVVGRGTARGGAGQLAERGHRREPHRRHEPRPDELRLRTVGWPSRRLRPTAIFDDGHHTCIPVRVADELGASLGGAGSTTTPQPGEWAGARESAPLHGPSRRRRRPLSIPPRTSSRVAQRRSRLASDCQRFASRCRISWRSSPS